MGAGMADRSLIEGLRVAVRAAPGNVVLRVELASALLDAGLLDEAEAECRAVLDRVPDHEAMLELAARVAEAQGDDQRASAYRRLLGTVQWSGMNGPTRIAADGPEDPVDRSDELTLDPDVDRPTVTLADVGGLEEVKRRINASFLAPMNNPELREAFGKSLSGGLLLYGPPGCGKTFLARAMAGELGARFFSVGLHQVLDMWLGNSEKNVHEIFDTARRNVPCVLFCDEVDALGQKRTHLRHQAGRSVVVQFLAEMDGAKYSNEGVFVLGATNHPWDIDPALLRPGRFDRTILVLPPDIVARIAILRYHLKGRRLDTDIDVVPIAEVTETYSGADLEMICETAAELALEDSIAAGEVRPIGMHDLIAAAKQVRPSSRAWFETARNYAEFSNADGEYDELLDYMRRNGM